ncbi:MAG: suppressor of fused domain protein [Pseudomonadota bacterium]
MNLEEYKQKYADKDDAAPGWDAIDGKLSSIYGEQEPMHFAPAIRYMLGGPDPIDGLSIYKSNAGGQAHYHFCSYGFSGLYYEEESAGGEFSGWGFELTFRLMDTGQSRDELMWACNLVQNLARYVFNSKKWFEQYHWIPANGPIRLESNTDIVGLSFVTDPELGIIDTPHGKLEFLQMVGLTSKELELIKAGTRTPEEIVDALRLSNPLLITDLDRVG